MARGGERSGAGRRKDGKPPKQKINITIEGDLLEAIDRMTENRSRWFEEAARQAIAAAKRAGSQPPSQ